MYSDNETDTHVHDYREIATEIAEWCERNYGYFIRGKADKIKTIEEFADQLSRLTDGQINARQIALNQHFDTGVQHPPVPAQLLKTMRQIAPLQERKMIAYTEAQIDWFGLWKNSSHERKMDFFRNQKLSDIPAFVKYEAKKYYMKEASMTSDEANNWIRER